MYIFQGEKNPGVACSGRDGERRKGKRYWVCGVGETSTGMLESDPEELGFHAL